MVGHDRIPVPFEELIGTVRGNFSFIRGNWLVPCEALCGGSAIAL
jgi:hypothetical protein